MVIVPPEQDAFAIHFDFVNFHEFDDAEYTLKIVMEDGVTLLVSGLGNDFDTFHEKINQLLGGMYETLVNEFLKEVFPHFHVATLLKLGFKMRGGKAVSQKDVEKMDKELASAIDDFIFENEDFKAKTQVLRDETDEYGVFYGIAQDEKIEGSYVKWTMFAVPNHNIVGFSILPRWKQGGEDQEEERYPDDMYFFKIIMEKGTPAEKVEDKVREINQALVILNFVKDPCYQDKRELKHSPYQYAIRKLPFLRILRKSYIGKASSKEVGEWHKQVKEVFKNAALK